MRPGILRPAPGLACLRTNSFRSSSAIARAITSGRRTSRVVGAAELQAAALPVGPVTAEDIMSRDLVTVGPQTPKAEVVRLLRRHRFTSIPVVGTGGRYLGVIFQIHLIRAAGQLNESSSQLMQQDGPQATPATPFAELLSIMADSEIDAVPVLEEERIIGIVTRTDLISALARASASQSQ